MKEKDYIREIRKSGINRLEVCRRMGLSYSQLNMRLGGFSKWQDGEIEKLESILEKAKAK
jgi:hypothetical protein